MYYNITSLLKISFSHNTLGIPNKIKQKANLINKIIDKNSVTLNELVDLSESLKSLFDTLYDTAFENITYAENTNNSSKSFETKKKIASIAVNLAKDCTLNQKLIQKDLVYIETLLANHLSSSN